jgi:capsular polysaccharide biosynthesis protein
MHLLFKYDFQRVVIERLPLQDQIGLMAEARCLVVPHGSGTVHSLFMSPQSLVVELFDANYVNPCMLPTMEFLKHRYFMIPNASLNKLEDGHFLVNTYCLDVTLKRELEEQNGVMAIA